RSRAEEVGLKNWFYFIPHFSSLIPSIAPSPEPDFFSPWFFSPINFESNFPAFFISILNRICVLENS
ncbi:MAG TPA: hypothetical protein PLL06_21310, partial [Acidobacteriota bacterium]|nr:hypothetical protein [Acidobacteriota bacterium]HNJ41198.1 hypothetical protein [Acidobacteriota bacterium]